MCNIDTKRLRWLLQPKLKTVAKYWSLSGSVFFEKPSPHFLQLKLLYSQELPLELVETKESALDIHSSVASVATSHTSCCFCCCSHLFLLLFLICFFLCKDHSQCVMTPPLSFREWKPLREGKLIPRTPIVGEVHSPGM